MKRFLLTAFAVLIVLAGGLYALSFFALDRFKPRIEQAVRDATGRSFSIDGSIHAGLSFHPTVVVENIALGNADWAEAPHFLKASRADIKISLLPLFAGNVDVDRLEVVDASLNLESDGAGRENWSFSSASEKKSGGDGDGLSVAELPVLLFDNVAISYRSAGRGVPLSAQLDRFMLTPQGNRADIEFAGQLNGVSTSIEARVEASDTSFSAAPFEIYYGDYSLSGTLEGERQSVRQPFNINGKLHTETVDITPLLAGDGRSDEDERFFSPEPLPFGWLTAANGQIEISAARVTYRAVELRDINASLSLEEGKLDLPVKASYMGGLIDAKLTARAGETPQAGLDIKAPKLNAGQLLKDLEITAIAELTGQFGVDIEGRGGSLQEIAASLNGEAGLVTGEGQLNSTTFELIAADLVFALIPRGEEGNVAQVNCFASHATFKNGIGTVDQLVLATERVRTYGRGTIDLRDEQLDLTLEPKPVDASLLSLATPIHVHGTLSNPDASLDRSAILGDVALAVGGTVLTGGVGAILPFMSAGETGTATQACLRSAAEEGSKGIAGRAGEAAQDVIEGAGDAIEGVGDFLTSPFR